MNELIKIEERDGQQVVSARELYEFMEVGERFSRWIGRMFEYGFENGVDYTPYHSVHPQNKQESVDYALAIDTAKEIAMLQRSEKGKQARQYFIECERKLKSMDMLDLMVHSAQQIREQARRLQQIEASQSKLLERMETVAAKVTAVNDEFFTLAGYYQLQGQRFNLTTVQAQQTGKTLKRKSQELGYVVGSSHSEKYGRVNSYHRFVLQAVLGF